MNLRSMVRSFALLTLTLLSTIAVGAQESPTPFFLFEEMTRSNAEHPLSAVAVQAWSIEVRSDMLASAPEVLHFFLPDGRLYEASQQYFDFRETNDLSWFGKTDTGGSVVFTLKHGALGAVIFEDAVYQIIPNNGNSLLVEIDQTLPEKCGVEYPALESKDVDTCNDGTGFTPATSLVTIDVMALYTPEAQTAAAGTEDIEVVIQNAIDAANLAFMNSDVHIHFHPAHIGLVPLSYTEVGGTPVGLLLNAIDNPDIQALRNEHSADLVGIFVADTGDPGTAGTGATMTNGWVGPQFSEMAFQITQWNFAVGQLTYTHEHGHNMGLEHDLDTAQIPGHEFSNTPENASFCFSFGHIDPAASTPFRTVMGTQYVCAGCTRRIDYFSNYLIDDPVSGEPTGIIDASDNHRTLNLTAPIVVNFRPKNDNFGSRFTLTGTSGQTTSNNDGATRETNEPFHEGLVTSSSVWWEWTAPVSGMVTFDSMGSSFPSLVAVYTGPSISSLTPVIDDDVALDLETFDATGNVTYLIAVDIDSTLGNTGDVDLSWNLTPGTADIGVSLSADAGVVEVGESVFFTATISNAGPQWATNVTLTDVLGPDLQYVFAHIPGNPFSDDCMQESGTVTCIIDIFPDVGNPIQVVIEATVLSAGTISNTVSVDAVEDDPVATNDSATVEIIGANPGDADLSVTLTDLSDPVIMGNDITWLVNVRNNGPSQATNVVLTDVLPASVTFTGTNMPGTCSEVTGTVTCQIGTLGSGTSFPTIEITATANQGGTVINAVDLSGTEGDPQPLNNTVQVSTSVLDPGALFEHKLTASDAAIYDYFGYSVALSGETVVVGAYGDDNPKFNSGSAYVFVRNGTIWTQQQELTASDATVGDYVGYSVGISGDTIVVGAYANDDAGSTYMFVRNGTTWTLQQKLTASDAAAWDSFGYSVGISGETVVVGARSDDDGGSNSGSAYVFVRSGTIWTQQQKLTASDAAEGDQFGTSVTISGNTVVVGAGFDDDGGSASGSVYVFVRNGTTWTEEQKLTASDAAAGDLFGVPVAISEETVVAGAFHDDDGGGDSGSAYVFVRDGAIWTQQQKLTASDATSNDRFGVSVALSGEAIVVGTHFDDDAGTNSGSAYVFVRDGTTWTQEQKLTASDAAADDQFGISVAISGETAVVGAYGDDDGGSASGSAYVYDLSTLPTPTITLTAPSTSSTFHPEDPLTIQWTSTNTDPADSMVLAMKRDSVPPSVTTPDDVNWARFTTDTPNDGSELVTIPQGVAFATDWRFYVRHDASGAYDGTDITFTVEPTPTADLSVSLSDTPDPVIVGGNITYTVTVTNSGPNDATGVVLTDTLPTEVTFLSTNQPGVCSEAGGTVTCTIGNLMSGTSFPAIEIVATTTTVGAIINAVDLSGAELDSNPLNNTAQVSTEAVDASDLIFTDGFESGNTSAWSSSVGEQ